MLEKTINRAKTKGNKAFENVELTDEMKKKVLDTFRDGTFDQNELNQTVDEVKQELAKQIKATKFQTKDAAVFPAEIEQGHSAAHHHG